MQLRYAKVMFRFSEAVITVVGRKLKSSNSDEIVVRPAKETTTGDVVTCILTTIETV